MPRGRATAGMLSSLPSLALLGAAALAALVLTLRRRSAPEQSAARSAAARALALALGVQVAHLLEEAATGFPQRLGAVVGLPAMPFAFFLAFNLVWLGIWAASIRGLRSARREAFFAAWFLAIAGAVNGIAHPVLALVSGGYFPGLVSSPFIAVAAVRLGDRLLRATRPSAQPGDAPPMV